MELYFEGVEVYFNPWLPKSKIMKTDDNQVIMHPYTGACMMLETTTYEYKDVFKQLGVTNHAVDACIDSALKLLYFKIDKPN